MARHLRSVFLAVALVAFCYAGCARTVRTRAHPTAGGLITTVAGSGEEGYSGDGGLAIKAKVDCSGLAVGPDGSLYIADASHQRVRKVDRKGIITTVAGDGWSELGASYRGRFRGDGGPATKASLDRPCDVAVDSQGNLYIADSRNQRIRKVDRKGIITTVAGDGWSREVMHWPMGGPPGYPVREGRFAGDGGPATKASLHNPTELELGPDGSLYILDDGSHRVRKVDSRGIVTTVAGIGGRGMAVGPDGSVYTSDTYAHRVHRVSPSGMMTVAAGDGWTAKAEHRNWFAAVAYRPRGRFRGDGGPAVKASLNWPEGLAVAPDGSLFIADTGNGRIRMVNPAGMITTVSGSGKDIYLGDGGPATKAALGHPEHVAVGPDGSLHISAGNRVRKVTWPASRRKR